MKITTAASSLLLVETSEWFDWLRRELPLGGVRLPDEETAVWFIERALHLADRARGTYHHLPETLRYRLLKASIVYQCWEQQKSIQEKAGWKRGTGTLAAVNAVSYVAALDTIGRHHLVDASDGFQYAITLSNRLWTETLPATELICNELARLFGLNVPGAAVVAMNPDLLRLADKSCEAFTKLKRRSPEFCCGFRYTSPSDHSVDQAEPRVGRYGMQQLRGALVFDIWTLNLASRSVLLARNASTGKSEVVLATMVNASWVRTGTSSVPALIVNPIPRRNGRLET